MIEVTVDSIQVSLISQHRLVVLKEINAERYLPIWIGAFEAEAVSIRLQGIETPRPLTHDLIVNLLQNLGAQVRYIFISALRDDTFYARLVLDVNGTSMEIDSRPSDAIAIAVRLQSPIYVDEAVMTEAGVIPERNLLDPSKDEEQDLGVFRQFLDTLNMDDLERND